jgi:hypothetical protein
MIHLISDTLVDLIQKNNDEVIKRWIARLKIDPTTASYQKNIEYLGAKAKDILKYIGGWVSYDTTKEDVGKRYAQEGMETFRMKIPLCEVILKR